MKHLLKKISLMIGLIGAMNSVQAVQIKSALLYISPNEYNYSVHLLSPYYDYWFEQGPLVEPIAYQVLQAKSTDLALCKANETADRIIRITPHVFYNPQMQVYHSQLEATVYSGGGNVLGHYVGEAQQQGYASFDNGTRYHLNKAYKLAMQDLMTKIDINPASAPAESNAKLPCGLIGAESNPKINFY
ncbi:MAG: hypothetical protein H0W85_01630 [Methylotenera sp.]|nr:hypothetical protein [Methylotenera sp.]